MAKAKKSKKGKRRARKSKAFDVNLQLSLRMGSDGVASVKPERRKRIAPRNRSNLRTMRNGMGGLTAQNLRSPSFFGNTALLTNAAMAAMNNKSYALERQLLDNQAVAKTQQIAGKDTSALQELNQSLQRELELTRRLGSAAYQQGQQRLQDSQQEVEEKAAQVEQSEKRRKAEAASDQQLKETGAQVLGSPFTPEAFRPAKFKQVKPLLQKLYANPQDTDAAAELQKAVAQTARGKKKKKKPEPAPAPAPQPEEQTPDPVVKQVAFASTPPGSEPVTIDEMRARLSEQEQRARQRAAARRAKELQTPHKTSSGLSATVSRGESTAGDFTTPPDTPVRRDTRTPITQDDYDQGLLHNTPEYMAQNFKVARSVSAAVEQNLE